jgi:hypothetical protein
MSFPTDLEQVKKLVHDHQQLNEEPLVLALYYSTDTKSIDVQILEVLDGFGYNEVSADRDLFDVEYASTNGFHLPIGSYLRLVLTNPVEFRQALAERWPTAVEIARAVRRGNYNVVYNNDAGRELLTELNKLASDAKVEYIGELEQAPQVRTAIEGS